MTKLGEVVEFFLFACLPKFGSAMHQNQFCSLALPKPAMELTVLPKTT